MLTVVLGAGALAVGLCRSPVQRQRLVQGTLGLAALAAVLWSLPLPRLGGGAQPAPAWVMSLAASTRAARVLISNTTRRPFCFGTGAGTIVLPATLVHEQRERRLRAVLLHEHAHLAQRHGRARLFAALATPLLYWQPLFWWLIRSARQDAELVADDLASGSMNKRDYASELLELVQSSHGLGSPQALRMGAFGSRNHFLERMETLLMRTTPLTFRESRLQFLARSGAGLVLLTGVSLAWGRVPQERSEEPNPLASQKPDPESGQEQELEDEQWTTKLPAVRTQVIEDMRWIHKSYIHEGRAVTLADLIRERQAQAPSNPLEAGECVVEFEFGSIDELRRFQERVTDRSGQFAITSLHQFTSSPGLVKGAGVLTGLSSSDRRHIQRFLYDQRVPVGSSLPAIHFARELETLDGQIRTTLAQLAELRQRREALEDAQANLLPPVSLDHNMSGPMNLSIWAALDGPDTPRRDPSAIDAQVLAVTERAGVTHVTFNRGANHGVQIGTAFEVYLEASYKGRVEITSVNDESSVGKITAAAQPMAVGDSATTDL